MSVKRVFVVLTACCLARLSAWAEPWTFVSTPDFLNVDVGDLTTYDGPQFNSPSGNSTNATWENAIDTFLDRIAAENPDFVTVAGDLVMARWWQDGNPGSGRTAGDGVFGPKLGTAGYLTRDVATEQARVVNASDFYYDVWNERFDDRGLPVYVAMGDHELGDDPSWADEFGKQTIVTYREQFANHFVDQYGQVGNAADQAAAVASNTLASGSSLYSKPSAGQHQDTAYAIQHNNALIVSVDQFKRNADNSIDVTVADEQLAWLEQTLADANNDPTIDHIFVQGHTTVIQPVTSRASGNLTIEGETDSDFWQALRGAGADLYLSGEVHDVTIQQDTVNQDLLQISHGGIFGFQTKLTDLNQPEIISYLKGTVDGDLIQLEMKTMGFEVTGDTFYQPGNPTTQLKTTLTLENDPFETVGTLTIDKSSGFTQYVNPTGVFAGLAPPAAPALGFYTFTTSGSSAGFTLDRSVSQQPADATFSDFEAVGVQIALFGAQNQGRFSAGNDWPGSFPFVEDAVDYDDNRYMGFTITADEGFLLDVDSINFSWIRGGQKSATDAIMRVSSDGFLTFLEFEVFSDIARSFSDTNFPMTIDLSGLGLVGELDFRFYFKNENTDPSGAPWSRLDDVALRGAIVPGAVSGDYNGDGMVEGADYAFWRNNLGGSADVFAAGSRDSTLSGPIGAGDYSFWRANFGPTIPAETLAAATNAPEPTSVAIALFALAAAPALLRQRV